MIKHIFSYFLIGLVCLFSVSAEAQTYKFKPLDYPGAIRTAALGIDAGNIVGWYYDANGSAHGFLYDGTNWTPLDYPGAISSEAIGIDADAGIIIGAYTNEIFGSSHGFLYDGNTWTTLDYPDAWETIPAGIDDGIIVGRFTDFYTHGFLYDGNYWSPLVYPGAIYTDASGIDAGNIVGSYYGGGLGHGYLYDGVTWTSLDYPGAYISTAATGIDANNIVGFYFHEDWSRHGYLYSGADYSPLDYPGARETLPTGIDDGIIVGTYVDASYNQHGFLATPVIVIGGCNTGVEDKLLDTGYKMSDLIAQCATNATNHGKFVTCVDGLTSSWKKMRLITGKEQDAIQSCAAKADIP